MSFRNHEFRRTPGLWLAVALLLAATPAVGEVVLLKNGSVVAGDAQAAAGTVVVLLEGRGELRLREGEVATIQPTLGAAYAWLRDRFASDGATIDDHVALAEWCLRNELWPQAARELLDARQLNPASEHVAMLQRRLTQLSRPPTRRFDPAVKPASGESRLGGGEVSAASASTPDAEPELVLPPDAMKRFTRRIQPLLVNNCTAGGCHAPGDGGFELDRRLLHGYADSRSTWRNLRSVLAAIDPDAPAESALVVAARGPHAGVTPLTGPRRDEWLERLGAWVEAVVAAQPGYERAAAPSDAARETDPNDEVAVAHFAREVENTGDASHATPNALPPARVVRGGRVEAVGFRDDFDPEIFNRRHRTPDDDLPIE